MTSLTHSSQAFIYCISISVNLSCQNIPQLSTEQQFKPRPPWLWCIYHHDGSQINEEASCQVMLVHCIYFLASSRRKKSLVLWVSRESTPVHTCWLFWQLDAAQRVCDLYGFDKSSATFVSPKQSTEENRLCNSPRCSPFDWNSNADMFAVVFSQFWPNWENAKQHSYSDSWTDINEFNFRARVKVRAHRPNRARDFILSGLWEHSKTLINLKLQHFWGNLCVCLFDSALTS